MKKSLPAEKPPLNIPDFKSYDEEALWWEANEDLMFERSKKYGSLIGPFKLKVTEAPTKAISIRIPVEDLARVQAIAKKKGIPYQTYINKLIHKAVRP